MVLNRPWPKSDKVSYSLLLTDMADEEKFMTVLEFNDKVRNWGKHIVSKAKMTLAQTHGSGKLAEELNTFFDQLSKIEPFYKVKFSFMRYGVFRAYGAGRGYVIINGVPVRGYRVRSYKEIDAKTYGIDASEMLKRGYSRTDVNKAKKVKMDDLRRVARTPLDWLDGHINANIGNLADTAQQFYGDDALKQILQNFPKTKIKKR